MKDTPTLFSREMAIAAMGGFKSQTRRMLNLQPPDGSGSPPTDWGFRCPYGGPGDRLLCLTGWATSRELDDVRARDLHAGVRIWSWFDGAEKPEWCGRLRMGRHIPGPFRTGMPRAMIKEVRLQNVLSITEEDAIAEGFQSRIGDYPDDDPFREISAREGFLRAFFDINHRAKAGTDPWVWAITFLKLRRPG